MIPESQIGKNIKALRLSRKLTLEALAGKAGLTKGYLSKVENSKKSPPVSTLIVIAKALGVTLSRIFGEENTSTAARWSKRRNGNSWPKPASAFGYSYETLAQKYPNKKMEPSILTIPADSEESACFSA
jgi:transcriptional regulator with XRE-family HTH domain